MAGNKREIVGTLTLPGSTCANCKFRKEMYRNIPAECTECGWLSERNDPYEVDVPIYADEYDNENGGNQNE